MPLHPHPHDLPSPPPAIPEITFLRSQLSRTTREHTLRLALLSNSYNSRVSQLSGQYDELSGQYDALSHQHDELSRQYDQLSRQHDAAMCMHDAQMRMHDSKVMLVKRECEGKAREVEALQCELESLRCRYDATVDIMRREAEILKREADETVRGLKGEMEELVVAQRKAQDEWDVKLTEVRKEKDEGIEVKDAEIEELREKIKTLEAENAALTLARNAQARTAKVKNLPTAPRAMIMASATASASSSSSSFISSSSSSSFLSQSQSSTSSTSSIATSAPSSSVSPTHKAAPAVVGEKQHIDAGASASSGAPRCVPGAFFPTGVLFGQQVKFGTSQANLVSFTPHSNVRATSAFPPSTSTSSTSFSTSLSSNAHLPSNNTSLSNSKQMDVAQPLHQTQTQTQTKSQTKPASTIIQSDKPSAFATLTNNPHSHSTSAFASASNTNTSTSLPGTTSSSSTSSSRMPKRAHSSAFMDDYESEYVSPVAAPAFSLIDRIEPRTSTTLPARKRPHCSSLTVTGVKIKTGTAAEGLKLDRMNLDDCDEQDAEDRDIVTVKTEQNDDILSPIASSVKAQSKCSTTTTVKTESPCDTHTRIRLRSGAFGTFTYSRRRL